MSYKATEAKGGLVDTGTLVELLRKRGIDPAKVDPAKLEQTLKKLTSAPRPLEKSDFTQVK